MAKLGLYIPLFIFSPNLFGAGAGGVSLTAEKAFMIGSLPVTNSMVTSWIISIIIILTIRLLVGKATLVPGKGQLFVESIVGGMRGIVEPIVGNRAFFASFWLLSGLFIFILINNWSGLLPGVGTLGDGYYDDVYYSELRHTDGRITRNVLTDFVLSGRKDEKKSGSLGDSLRRVKNAYSFGKSRPGKN